MRAAPSAGGAARARRPLPAGRRAGRRSSRRSARCTRGCGCEPRPSSRSARRRCSRPWSPTARRRRGSTRRGWRWRPRRCARSGAGCSCACSRSRSTSASAPTSPRASTPGSRRTPGGPGRRCTPTPTPSSRTSAPRACSGGDDAGVGQPGALVLRLRSTSGNPPSRGPRTRRRPRDLVVPRASHPVDQRGVRAPRSSEQQRSLPRSACVRRPGPPGSRWTPSPPAPGRRRWRCGGRRARWPRRGRR